MMGKKRQSLFTVTILIIVFFYSCTSNPSTMGGILNNPNSGAIWKSYLLIGESGSESLRVFDLKKDQFVTVPVFESLSIKLPLDGPPSKMVVTGDELYIGYATKKGLRVIDLKTLLDEDPSVESRWIDTESIPLLCGYDQEKETIAISENENTIVIINKDGNTVNGPFEAECSIIQLLCWDKRLYYLCDNRKSLKRLDPSTEQTDSLKIQNRIIRASIADGLIFLDSGDTFYTVSADDFVVNNPHPFNQLFYEAIPISQRISAVASLKDYQISIDNIMYENAIAIGTLNGDLYFFDRSTKDLIYTEDNSETVSDITYSVDKKDLPRIDEEYFSGEDSKHGILFDPFSLFDYRVRLTYRGILASGLIGTLHKDVFEVESNISNIDIKKGDIIVIRDNLECGLKRDTTIEIVDIDGNSLIIDGTSVPEDCVNNQASVDLRASEGFVISTDKFGYIGRVLPGEDFRWIKEDDNNPVLGFHVTEGTEEPQTDYYIEFAISDQRSPYIFHTNSYSIADMFEFSDDAGIHLGFLLPAVNGVGILERPDSTSPDDLTIYYY